MIIDVSSVRVWVQQYLAGEITKQELSKWAYEALYFLLNGEFYKLENIALYRIIVILTQVDDYDPCTHADIQQIWNILNGQEDAFYTIHARIKLDYQEEEVQKIRCSFINYKEQFRLTKKEIEDILFFIDKAKRKASTIIDLLNAEIAAYLSSGYHFDPAAEEVRFGFHCTYCVGDEEKEDKYLDKLFYLLDCACGENTFCVFINYQAGVPSVTLI